MTLKAAIFDMDGVVVDTVPIHFNAWKKMFGEYGHDLDFEEYKQKVDGIPRIDGTKNVLTHLSIDELKSAAKRKQGYFLEELNSSEIPTYPTTLKLIEEFISNHIKVGVISASKNATHILERIDLLDKLDTVVSGHDVTKGKPDPQVFLMAAKKLGVQPDECIVFEDAILGVEAAKRAQMVCIGIDRYDEPQRLAKADRVVKDLAEVGFQSILDFFS